MRCPLCVPVLPCGVRGWLPRGPDVGRRPEPVPGWLVQQHVERQRPLGWRKLAKVPARDGRLPVRSPHSVPPYPHTPAFFKLSAVGAPVRALCWSMGSLRAVLLRVRRGGCQHSSSGCDAVTFHSQRSPIGHRLNSFVQSAVWLRLAGGLPSATSRSPAGRGPSSATSTSGSRRGDGWGAGQTTPLRGCTTPRESGRSCTKATCRWVGGTTLTCANLVDIRKQPVMRSTRHMRLHCSPSVPLSPLRSVLGITAGARCPVRDGGR